MLEIKTTQSRVFTRPSRTLNELKFWKASEYRTFILYTGPVVLKNILPPDLYENFLYLHVGIKLCLKSKFFMHLDIAQQLFVDFVTSFENCYGSHLMSSNVHNIIHLVECVRMYGELGNFSAFPYESTLGSIKLLIRKSNQELQQVAKRLFEFGGLLDRYKNY